MPFFEIISLLAFSLGWFSLGVTILIAHNQSKIKEALDQEKMKRHHRALIRLADSIFSVHMDFEFTLIEIDENTKPHPVSKMMKEHLDQLKQTIHLYYPDLTTQEISLSESILCDLEKWLENPYLDIDLSLEAKIHLCFPTDQTILKKLYDLDELIKDEVKQLDKLIIQPYSNF